MRYRKYKILPKCKTPRYTGGLSLLRALRKKSASPRAAGLVLLVVWTGAWHHPLSRLVVIAQLQKARSYSVERDVGKATFFFPLSFYNKLSSNALRIWNKSSHLQNAQHFLRGSQVVGHEMPAFSRKVAGNGSRETEMHRLITENENLSGGGGTGAVILLEGSLSETRTKSGTPTIAEKGRSHGTESKSGVGGPWELRQLPGSTLGWAGPLPWPLGASFSWVQEGGPGPRPALPHLHTQLAGRWASC